MSQVAIIDYGVGNLRSVEKAFAATGCEAIVTGDENELRAAREIRVAWCRCIWRMHEGAQRTRLRSIGARTGTRGNAVAWCLCRHAVAL